MKRAICCGLGMLVVLAMAASNSKHPVVGVLSKPVDERDPSKGGWISGSVVRWLQSAGLRVTPLHYDLNASALSDTLSRLNGVLFTGGGLTLKRGTTYFDTQQRIWDIATTQTPGLPIFGVCMGFQALCILAAKQDDEHKVLSYGFDSENYNIPLEFILDIRGSRMFGDAPAPLLMALATTNITLNSHTCSVVPDTFTKYPSLGNFFAQLSTNVDRRGVQFVSTIEARDHAFNIWGTQWHPEANSWIWDDSLGTDHNPDATWAALWALRAFTNAARENPHRFPSEAEEVAALVDSTTPVWSATHGSQTWYYKPQK